MAETRIIYSGFYDYPLAFVAWHGAVAYLFLRDFDEAIDDYPRAYEAYELPLLSEAEIRASWCTLPERATRRLGSVPLDRVRFDSTKRQSIDSAIFAELEERRTLS